MEEKREELTSEKQKILLQRLLKELSQEHVDFYYKPTMEIAHALKAYIEKGANLNKNERDLLAPLSVKDIQLRFSLS